MSEASNIPPFESLVYTRPDAAFIDDLFRKTRLLMRGARSAESLIGILREFDAAWLSLRSTETLARIRRVTGPDRSYYRNECSWFENRRVTDEIRMADMIQGLDQHRCRKEAETIIGRHVFRTAGRLHASISPVIADDLAKEQQLEQAIASSSIAAVGYSNPDHRHFAWNDAEEQTDDERRHRLYLERAGQISATLKQRERIFDSLIDTRTRLATKMGYRNYLEYALVRHGIERAELDKRAEFRRLVKTHIVPLCRQIRILQTERLDKNELEPADYYFLMREVWPEAKLRKEQTRAAYAESFSTLGDTLGKYFPALLLQGYVNDNQAETAALRAPALFLPEASAVYLNVGDERLSTFVPSLFYATGIALGSRLFFYEKRSLLTICPPLLHRALTGTAFMVLSYPEWERFLGRVSRLAEELEWTRRLLEIPLMCAIEAFEEQLYQNPGWNIAERSQLWHRLKQQYLPDEAGTDHLSIMPYGMDWLMIDQLADSPLHHTEQAMADVMVLSSKPFLPKNRSQTLAKQFRRLISENTDGTVLERAMGAGFLSPYETNTFRMAAFSAAMLLGL